MWCVVYSVKDFKVKLQKLWRLVYILKGTLIFKTVPTRTLVAQQKSKQEVAHCVHTTHGIQNKRWHTTVVWYIERIRCHSRVGTHLWHGWEKFACHTRHCTFTETMVFTGRRATIIQWNWTRNRPRCSTRIFIDDDEVWHAVTFT